MTKARYLILCFCACVSACSAKTDVPGKDVPGKVAGEIYVLVSPEKSARFTTDLASVVQNHGLRPNNGQATDDRGHTLFVLDATGPAVRLRSENVLLSGHEDPKRCGVYDEAHPDPGQFFVSVSPAAEDGDPRAALALLEKLSADLSGLAYDVRRKPVECSEQSLAASKG